MPGCKNNYCDVTVQAGGGQHKVSMGNEIDIVVLDDDTDTVWFGECTWSNTKAGVEIYTDLVKK